MYTAWCPIFFFFFFFIELRQTWQTEWNTLKPSFNNHLCFGWNKSSVHRVRCEHTPALHNVFCPLHCQSLSHVFSLSLVSSHVQWEAAGPGCADPCCLFSLPLSFTVAGLCKLQSAKKGHLAPQLTELLTNSTCSIFRSIILKGLHCKASASGLNLIESVLAL